MANQGGSYNNYVFVETTLNTRLVLPVHNIEIISDFKEKLCKEHKELYPQTGEINISAMKFYYLPDSMIISKAYEGITKTWFMYADVVRVEGERLAMVDVDPSNSHPKQISTGSKGSLEVGLKPEVKKEKKRKVESSGGNKSRKKPTIDLNLSVAITASRSDVDEGNVKVKVVSSEICAVSPRGKLDDILTGAIGKGIESGVRNGISVEENQQTSEADKLCQKKILTVDSKLVHGSTSGEESAMAPSAAANPQTAELVTNPENQLGANSNLITSPTEKKSSRGHIDEATAAATTTTSSDPVNPNPISRSETLGNPLVEAIQKEHEMGEKFVENVGGDKMEADNLGSHVVDRCDTNIGLTTIPVTEKKKRRKKNSQDHINQSSAADTVSSKEIVKENKVPGNVDQVDASPESYLGNPFAEAKQRENEMVGKIDDNVGAGKAIPTTADNIQTGNFVTDLENQMEATPVLATSPSTEKKRKHRKSSKDQINQSTTDTTTSRKTVNEREKLSGCVDVSSESFPHSRGEKLADTLVEVENEMGVKFVDNVGLTDNLQVADLASTQVQESKMLEHIGKLNDEYRIDEHEVAKDNSDINAGEAKSLKTTKKKKSKRSKTPGKGDSLVASGAHNVEPLVKVDSVIKNVLDSLQQKKENEENRSKIGKKASKKSKKKDSAIIVEAHQEPGSSHQ